MYRMAQFYKVSWEQFLRDWNLGLPENMNKKDVYKDLVLPKRATVGSAGYDFFSPCSFDLAPHETIKIPTGIRVSMNEGWVLQIFPRSSLGFSYRLQMNNTVGIIDRDYFFSDNEGHIFVKLTNDTNQDKHLHIKKGQAIVQGIFLSFGITEDDQTTQRRNGGFGSTDQ